MKMKPFPGQLGKGQQNVLWASWFEKRETANHNNNMNAPLAHLCVCHFKLCQKACGDRKRKKEGNKCLQMIQGCRHDEMCPVLHAALGTKTGQSNGVGISNATGHRLIRPYTLGAASVTVSISKSSHHVRRCVLGKERSIQSQRLYFPMHVLFHMLSLGNV